MRAVALTIISFVYIFSASLWMVDNIFLAPIGIIPVALDGSDLNTAILVNNGSEGIRSLSEDTLNPSRDGSVLDLVGDFVDTGYISVWTLLDLLTGVHMFNVLETIGVNPFFVLMIKLIYPLLVAVTVIYFLIGRY